MSNGSTKSHLLTYGSGWDAMFLGWLKNELFSINERFKLNFDSLKIDNKSTSR